MRGLPNTSTHGRLRDSIEQLHLLDLNMYTKLDTDAMDLVEESSQR